MGWNYFVYIGFPKVVKKLSANILMYSHFPGEDISVCVCLAILMSLFNDGGVLPYLASSLIDFYIYSQFLFERNSNYFTELLLSFSIFPV